MIETQLFGSFIPKNSKYLLLGGFSAVKKEKDDTYNWFYCSKRSQFWPIIEKVYNIKLENTDKKKKLLSKLHIAIADTIYQCERKLGNSSDSNLVNFKYNIKGVKEILINNNIQKIIFTSKFAEKIFSRNFKMIIKDYPKITFETLPSPSPRYAKLSKDEKVSYYIKIFPKQ